MKHCLLWLFLFSGIIPSLAQAETLLWNANTEANLAGYKVYKRTATQSYGLPIATLGKVTSYDTGVLPVGQTFFVLTAYNTAGMESDMSAEVSKIVLPTPQPPTVEERLGKIEATLTALCRALGGCTP